MWYYHFSEHLPTRSVKNELTTRWQGNPKTWHASIQREIILHIFESDQDFEWSKQQLTLLESFMLDGLDVHGRVEACESQAKAWLYLGDKSTSISNLYQLAKSAR